MSFESCPNWICNQDRVPYGYVYFLTGVITSIPYLALIRYLYKKYELSQSKRAGCLFQLATPIGYVVYCTILCHLFLDSKYEILSFIGIVAYVPIITLIMFIPILIIGMVTVLFMGFDNSEEE